MSLETMSFAPDDLTTVHSFNSVGFPLKLSLETSTDSADTARVDLPSWRLNK